VSQKSRWQTEFDALPEWVQKMVRACGGCAGYGGGGADTLLSGMSAEDRKKYSSFHVLLREEAYMEWFEGFSHLRSLASAMTAPWPPPLPPKRERRVLNLVELIADEEEGGGFDQPCAFGNRVGHHAVYCHNDAWPDAPSKCRRGKECAEVYGIPEEENRHEDCPGFVANPDFVVSA
jgi:hypothetical protein